MKFAFKIRMKLNRSKQQNFLESMTRLNLSYGGELRKKRSGRGARPLSSKCSHHIVFKINRNVLSNKSFRHPRNFQVIQKLTTRYSKKFFVKIEQVSYQHDHIHFIARSSRRSFMHSFFRVFAGQVAQLLKVTDTKTDITNKVAFWKYRPFSRIIKGWKNFKMTQAYVQLNELEILGKIPYRKERLKGLFLNEWSLLSSL
ncbi:MAG: hypothetical protein A2622_01730 [Bdellovibrionales bacterium RIFCSPHIGHO2_01_FULL_40_29]|nr:MAG: hypothetical protein A2622_01730 [Bdellovibrionales bacterium RIFCSPHIGHO2_01_FULL_40_29]OFZ33815.1 MAG: hypothetical protein A3D17_02150 [Bdellovibrionales bacterium RIFCSPHIGHO2_02_FULL_40_15]